MRGRVQTPRALVPGPAREPGRVCTPVGPRGRFPGPVPISRRAGHSWVGRPGPGTTSKIPGGDLGPGRALPDRRRRARSRPPQGGPAHQKRGYEPEDNRRDSNAALSMRCLTNSGPALRSLSCKAVSISLLLPLLPRTLDRTYPLVALLSTK